MFNKVMMVFALTILIFAVYLFWSIAYPSIDGVGKPVEPVKPVEGSLEIEKEWECVVLKDGPSKIMHFYVYKKRGDDAIRFNRGAIVYYITADSLYKRGRLKLDAETTDSNIVYDTYQNIHRWSQGISYGGFRDVMLIIDNELYGLRAINIKPIATCERIK